MVARGRHWPNLLLLKDTEMFNLFIAHVSQVENPSTSQPPTTLKCGTHLFGNNPFRCYLFFSFVTLLAFM